MAEYYLVSQLPSLDALNDSMPLPITEERFCELCREHLGKKALDEFNKITLLPQKEAEKSSSMLIEAWNDGERNLRFALCKVRAEKRSMPFCEKDVNIQSSFIETARGAVDIESPMEAEIYLNNYRLSFLEGLRPTDTFCEDYIFYYGLKLKLISRMRRFDKAEGMAAYKEIYNSIIKKEESEAIQ